MAADRELQTVQQAFDAAFHRMCLATNEGELEEELSNMLHHLYRLSELCRVRLGDKAFHVALDSLDEAKATRWVRAFDTHRLFATASIGDVLSDFYTEMYGVLVWKPVGDLPTTQGKHGENVAYATTLEGRPVLDTLRRAFGQLADLL